MRSAAFARASADTDQELFFGDLLEDSRLAPVWNPTNAGVTSGWEAFAALKGFSGSAPIGSSAGTLSVTTTFFEGLRRTDGNLLDLARGDVPRIDPANPAPLMVHLQHDLGSLFPAFAEEFL